MLVCEHCGKDFVSCDGILVCENGHVLEQNLEVVEGEFSGRKASSSLKLSEKKQACTNFTHLRILFKVYQHYKAKYDLEDDTMKIFLQNIKFTGVFIKESERLISTNLLVLILYLSLRIKNGCKKPYFVKDFINDIFDLGALINKHKLENDCREKNVLIFLAKVNMVFLINQLGNLDLDFKMNKYMLTALDCGFAIFVEYFLRIISDIGNVYDFTEDENFYSSELDFSKFNLDKKNMVESLLRIRAYGAGNGMPSTEKNVADQEKFLLLRESDFKVHVDNKKDGDRRVFFINALMKNLHIINTSQIARETLTSYFLKFVFISDLSDRLFFYELEVCSFLYAYVKSKRKSDSFLSDMLDFLLKYLNCSAPFFARHVRKVFKLFSSSSR